MVQNNCYFLLFFPFFLSCSFAPEEPTPSSSKKFAIVIHGGAGTILKKNMTPEKEQAYTAALTKAVQVGHTILQTGGTSLEAVEKTIHVLENSPLFNAGKGAVFTHDGTNEMDASIMDGSTLQAGAVAGVKNIKNPISAALKVMTHSDHVLLAGAGASEFAAAQGLKIVAPTYFYTEKRFQALKTVQRNEKTAFFDTDIQDSKYGTVGCVALDSYGNISAGTSTGGMTNKRWNRIGDSPIIGAGTYANNATCGVSSTGWGEYFIRGMVAHDISAQMLYKKVSLQAAAKDVIQRKLTKLGGTGGVVALDADGNIAFEFNTGGMYRASIDTTGKLLVKIYKE